MVRPKNVQAVISKLRDNYGRSFTKKEDLEKICLDFYKDLYKYKEILERTLNKILEDLPAIFTYDMNGLLSRDVMEKELSSAIISMAEGKAPRHDEIPIKFFKKMWPTIGQDFYRMILKGIEEGSLHEGVTRGPISLIPKERDPKDLNYWRPIILLTTNYKIFAKTL